MRFSKEGDNAMPAEINKDIKRTCFVVMGFGKKTDFETGRTLDLDKSYKNMIKPAVQAAGLECVRADEIVHSGLIDVPMYEQLLKADVVVADLSTSNKNAFYELGIRHALRPYTTVVIAEDGIKTFPFDVSHVAVRQYHHMGEDIGFEEVMRFREALTNAISDIIKKTPRTEDSPVYTFLKGLTPPSIAAVVQAAVQTVMGAGNASDNSTRAAAPAGAATDENPESDPLASMASTHSLLMEQVEEAEDKSDFITAKSLLSLARRMMKTEATAKQEDPDILRRLARATYMSKHPSEEAALKDARDLLAPLSPHTSNDTETLGAWGSVHKRLWALNNDPADLDEAVRAYRRGFYLRNDYYNGINVAYLLNIRAANAASLADAITDFVQARRIRREVLAICDEWLAAHPAPDNADKNEEANKDYQSSKYWVLATMAEAYLGLGDEDKSQQKLQEALALAPESWKAASTNEQMKKLKPLLDRSPLIRINAEPEVTGRATST
jgi:tetratricopeptide (TPR) repeat protein